MTRHGQLYVDIIPPRSRYFDRGKFGRLFPTLQPFASDTPRVRKILAELGGKGGPMDPGTGANPDNPNLTAGFTFLGQFIDHDITFDPTSSLERQIDPEAVTNFRTPSLELDSVYGAGPGATPHLYDRTSRHPKFVIDQSAPRDLPRNSQNTAIIGDPRNDENVIVSQLHLAFLKFHNAVIDRVVAQQLAEHVSVFDEAQRLVRWHYQWIVLNEFLQKLVDKKTFTDVVEHRRLRFYRWKNEPFIPVEFSVAAYRFGHSQVRPFYQVNKTGNNGQPFRAPIFSTEPPQNPDDPDSLSGGFRAPRRFVDWDGFFVVNGNTPQLGKRIDTLLSTPLFDLPFITDEHRSLATRNLLRHLTFSLPSGQSVACAMEVPDPLTREELKDFAPFNVETPLWIYILREAEKRAGGERLGPVGGRIVAEVLTGLLDGDRRSFRRHQPGWRPTITPTGEFGIANLLTFAGVL